MHALANGIRDGAKWVVEAAANLGQEAINAIKARLVIASDSKAFIEVGGFSASGLESGFEKEMPAVTARMKHALTLPDMLAPKLLPLPLDGATTSALAVQFQAGTLFGGAGLGSDDMKGQEAAQTQPREIQPQVVDTTSESITRSVQELVTRTTKKSELVIKDETGRAELTHKKGEGKRIKLTDSGAFNG